MKYAICTLGCKVNQFETQAMETMLGELGHVRTENGDADAVIVNTCAVTAESGRKSRQAVRRLKAQNPSALVAVCGCFSQIEPEAVRELGADIIFGSGRRKELVEAIDAALKSRSGRESIDDPFRRDAFESLPAGALERRTRAYMKIEDGCQNFCTYCVIPFARGKVLSMPVEEIAAQAAELDRQGFKEIVVTGIEIASYGRDLGGDVTLLDAVSAAADNAKNARIRLGSIEPTVITEQFCSELAKRRNICRHFHLSLQSGCDKTLKSMHRKYDTARFYEAVCALRRHFPGCALTADLITGFPGETESDHRQTLEFIEKCGFAAMHVFPYSPRPGTKAAAMPEQLTHAVKERRTHEASEAAGRMQREYLASCIGQTLPVLFETEVEPGVWCGHSDNYCLTHARGENLHGVVRMIKIEGVNGEILIGNDVDFAEIKM